MNFVKRVLLSLLITVITIPLGFRLSAYLRESDDLADVIPAEGRMISTDLGQVFVLEEGPNDGPVLLFAHGTAAWSGLWQPTLDAAAAAGYHAIAFDMPPFGFSDRDDAGDYSRVRQAERVQALVDALDINPIIVAHSFGAGAMVEAVMRAPDRYAGLVVVDGAIGLGSHDNPGDMPGLLQPEVLRELAISLTATNPVAMRPLLKSLIHVDAAATRDITNLLRHPMTRVGTTAAFADWLPSLLVAPHDALSTRAENYAALDLPVIYIWGAEDTVTPLVQGEDLAAITPGASLITMSDVGHIPQIEAPELFQEVLVRAIRSMTSETR